VDGLPGFIQVERSDPKPITADDIVKIRILVYCLCIKQHAIRRFACPTELVPLGKIGEDLIHV
jgi:hypothetical protein